MHPPRQALSKPLEQYVVTETATDDGATGRRRDEIPKIIIHWEDPSLFLCFSQHSDSIDDTQCAKYMSHSRFEFLALYVATSTVVRNIEYIYSDTSVIGDGGGEEWCLMSNR
jgi:hypothetical protein